MPKPFVIVKAPEEPVIAELVSALEGLLEGCKHWRDQGDPLLVAARLAVAKAKGGDNAGTPG